jgi:hypothetical protein
VGYAKSDLVIPADGWGGHAAEANRAARVWGLEVNAKVHSETQAVPNQRLEQERPLMWVLPAGCHPEFEPGAVDSQVPHRRARSGILSCPRLIGDSIPWE